MLGERILAELDGAQTNNTLTRWLAHHTASLIDAADRARAEDAPDADARAAEARAAILDLWQHRSAWPTGWPPPRATAIVRLLQDLPDLEDPAWFRASAVGRLQDLHHHVLAVLADLVAAPGDGVEEGWLRTTGEHLTPDEVALLSRAVGAPSRLDNLLLRNESVSSRLRRQLTVSQAGPAAGPDGSPPPDGDVSATSLQEGASPALHPLVQLADAYRDTILDLLHRATAGDQDAGLPDQHSGWEDGAAEGTTV